MGVNAPFRFGPGFLVGIPTIDITGAAVANPTPVQFGIIQEASLDFSRTLKSLTGQYAFPVAMGAGVGKISGKAKNALINGALLNLMFGLTPAVGQNLVAQQEPGTIPAKTTYTVQVANYLLWSVDLGVKYGANGVAGQDGLPMTRVAAVTAVGQYSVASGVYTFYSGDAGLKVAISYVYAPTPAAPGNIITITNPIIGVAPVYQLQWSAVYLGNQGTWTLNQVMFAKLGLAGKLEDWTYPELDFECFADAGNNLATFSSAS